MATPTAKVVRNARKRGVKVYSRKALGILSTVYGTRRKTRPHLIIGNPERKDQRVDTVWNHITVTHAVREVFGKTFNIGIGSCMRTLHKIGMDRFGSGVSYNFAIHCRTGKVGVGQSLDAKGTHTINDKGIDGFSYDQNAVAVAIAFIGMPGMVVSDEAWQAWEGLVAALMDEGYCTFDFDNMPHSAATAKDCPTDVVRDRLPRLKKGAQIKYARSNPK